jgi:GT2 family glycosyltransferase
VTNSREDMVIGVCTYNRGREILRTLEAIAAIDRVGASENDCDARPRVTRCVVVNNNSADETAAVIDAFIAENPAFPFERIDELRQGKTFAMQTLFERTHEPIVAMLDDDTIPERGWARGMLAMLDDEPRAGVVGGPVRIVWESGSTRLARIYHRSLGDQLLGSSRVRLDDPKSFMMGASIAVRRDAWRDSGWNEARTLECHRGDVLDCGEDAELIIRIRRAGWQVWYTPDAAIGHIIPARRQTRAYLARLLGSVRRSEPMLEHIARGGFTIEEARERLARAKRLYAKNLLTDLRPMRRSIRLAERRGKVEGWERVIESIERG